MKTYRFGDRKGAYKGWVEIEARNLDHAIKVFKVQELYPEDYVEPKYVESSEYDSIQGRNRYTFKTELGEPLIFIHEKSTDGKGKSASHSRDKYKKVGEIPLSECIDVDMFDLLPRQTHNLLSAPSRMFDDAPAVDDGDDEEGEYGDEEEDTSLMAQSLGLVKLEPGDLMTSSKSEIRRNQEIIKAKMAELDAMKRGLDAAMRVMVKELNEKKKMIYMLETYLGVHEEIYTLSVGEAASEEEPLTLYQQILYMDEELGIWEDGGIDYRDIHKFDEWISNNYEKFLYAPKSVVAWQIRRKRKDYGDLDVMVASEMHDANEETYFLFRNGQNLYRIWSNIKINHRLFPALDEFEKLMESKELVRFGSISDYSKEKLQNHLERYMYGLIAVQGLILRTDLLGTTLRNEVNLLAVNGWREDRVIMVRDAETEHQLGDGRPRWRDFIKANRESIGIGTRIIMTPHRSAGEGEYGMHRYYWRTDPFKPNEWPDMDAIYLVDSTEKGSYSDLFIIKYKPTDTIYPRDYWEDPYKRKRRVSYRMYTDEMLNFDAITLEEIEYYRHNRIERGDYLEMLPALHYARNMKLKEQELEDDFIRLVASQMGWGALGFEKYKGVIQDAIDWWKLKNMWKRGLMTDDAKALRMIIKKLKAGRGTI
jgi:hypothetical protein